MTRLGRPKLKRKAVPVSVDLSTADHAMLSENGSINHKAREIVQKAIDDERVDSIVKTCAEVGRIKGRRKKATISLYAGQRRTLKAAIRKKSCNIGQLLRAIIRSYVDAV